jgi:hypothetical protein
MHFLNFQGRILRKGSINNSVCLFGIIIDPEDGCSTFLSSVDEFLHRLHGLIFQDKAFFNVIRYFMNNYIIREDVDVTIKNSDIYGECSAETSLLDISKFRHAVSNHMWALCINSSWHKIYFLSCLFHSPRNR